MKPAFWGKSRYGLFPGGSPDILVAGGSPDMVLSLGEVPIWLLGEVPRCDVTPHIG